MTGLLDRLQGKQGVKVVALELPEASHVAVHGESFYQPTLHKTASLATEEDGELVLRAILLPEPGNKYDPNAVAVYSDAGIVGYLPRDVVPRYRRVFEEIERQGCKAGVCRGVLMGGTRDKPSYGVVLRLSSPRDCLRELESQD